MEMLYNINVDLKKTLKSSYRTQDAFLKFIQSLFLFVLLV